MRPSWRGAGTRAYGGALFAVGLAGALAMPARRSADRDDPDDDAKFNAKAVLISARLVYLANQSYAGVTPQALRDKNPDLRFVDDGPSTSAGVLSVKVVSPKVFRIAVYGIKTCWGVREEGHQSGVATLYARRPGPPSGCTASSFKDAEFREHELAWKR